MHISSPIEYTEKHLISKDCYDGKKWKYLKILGRVSPDLDEENHKILSTSTEQLKPCKLQNHGLLKTHQRTKDSNSNEWNYKK